MAIDTLEELRLVLYQTAEHPTDDERDATRTFRLSKRVPFGYRNAYLSAIESLQSAALGPRWNHVALLVLTGRGGEKIAALHEGAAGLS
jgi:hypothetical protein